MSELDFHTISVWGNRSNLPTRTVDQHILNLRSKLKQNRLEAGVNEGKVPYIPLRRPSHRIKDMGVFLETGPGSSRRNTVDLGADATGPRIQDGGADSVEVPVRPHVGKGSPRLLFTTAEQWSGVHDPIFSKQWTVARVGRRRSASVSQHSR